MLTGFHVPYESIVDVRKEAGVLRKQWYVMTNLLENDIMARKQLDVKVRLERQEKKILNLIAELEAEIDMYEKLLQKQEEAEKKRLLEVFQKNKQNLEELFSIL